MQALPEVSQGGTATRSGPVSRSEGHRGTGYGTTWERSLRLAVPPPPEAVLIRWNECP
jgi:hypothetical protein